MNTCATVVKCFLFLSCLLTHCFAQDNGLIITAHRAGAAYAPENSLAAAETAVDSKADRIEVDVRMTRDSVLVLMHDKKINRTTNGKGKLKKINFNDLQNYSLETDSGCTNHKVPTLEQLFKIVNKKKTLVLELKKQHSNPPGIEKQLVQFIQTHNAYEFCMVHSFSDKVLKQIHKLDTNIRLNKLFVCKMPFLPVLIDYNLRFKSLRNYSYIEDFSVNRHFISKRLINKIHRLNKKIHVWTINDAEKIEKLRAKGIDGVITDKLIFQNE